MSWVTHLPLVNAILNTTSACLLLAGYVFIRRGNVAAHKRCMLTALCTSALFLTSYLVYHFKVGHVTFRGEGAARSIYLAILGTHTVLAAVVVPFVLVTLTRALKGQFSRHKQVARKTLPIWAYVSVTGVVIYVLLYQIYAPKPQVAEAATNGSSPTTEREPAR